MMAQNRESTIVLLAFVVFGFISPSGAWAGGNAQASTENRSDAIITMADDPEIGAASLEAQQTLDFFLEHLENPEPDERDFCVAMQLPVDMGPNLGTETLWFTDLRASQTGLNGRLMDQPDKIRSLRPGDRVEIDLDSIFDWRFVKAGFMVGGRTLRVMLGKISPAQQARLLGLLPFEVEGFPEVGSAAELAAVSRHWRSALWGYSITFPMSWSLPRGDDESVLTKDIIDVYCDGPYGASVAVFANPVSDFESSLVTAISVYKQMVLDQMTPGAVFEDIELPDTVPGDAAAAFWYITRNTHKRAFYVFFHGQMVLTLSVIIPERFWDDLESDLWTIIGSIEFEP